MTRLAMIAALMLAPAAAHAGCNEDVSDAYARARPLPATPGRAALLEQIQRAEVAQHEGDEEECRSQLAGATEVLDKINAPSPPSQR